MLIRNAVKSECSSDGAAALRWCARGTFARNTPKEVMTARKAINALNKTSSTKYKGYHHICQGMTSQIDRRDLSLVNSYSTVVFENSNGR